MDKFPDIISIIDNKTQRRRDINGNLVASIDQRENDVLDIEMINGVHYYGKYIVERSDLSTFAETMIRVNSRSSK